MSWQPEVKIAGEGSWSQNGLRFPTREEAEENVRDLEMRWFAVRDTRVIQSIEPANYSWIGGKLVSLV